MRLVILVALVAILVLPAAAVPAGAATPQPAPPPDAGFNLRVRVVDGNTGRLLPARVSIIDSQGQDVYPIPPESSLYHDSYLGLRYFYAQDRFTVVVPAGTTVIRAMHGFEYRAVEQAVVVDRDKQVEVALFPFLNMPALGWRSGDTHLHMAHDAIGGSYNLTVSDLVLMQLAEDLHVANFLDNGLIFTGGIDSASTADHLLSFVVEYRSAFYGHLDVLGISQLVSFGCCSRGGYAFPMNVDLAAQARSVGGTVIFAHPITVPRDSFDVIDHGWPSVGHGRELPVDVALGAVDAMDVLSYSNLNRVEFGTWYDLLNHGFHLPATAGTDAGVNGVMAPPMGGFRVYAHVGTGAWTLENWLEALRRGQAFVTNGPLITSFQVGGVEMGGTLTLDPEGARHVTCYVDASSQWAITDGVILVNGLPRAYLPANADRTRIQGSVTIDTGGGSAWVALKVSGYQPNPFTIGPEVFAHSNPVYVNVPGKPLLFGGTDPAYYVRWVDDLWRLALQKGFASGADRDLTGARLSTARQIILNRTALRSDRQTNPLPPPPDDDNLLPFGATAPVGPVPEARALPGGRGIAFVFDAARSPQSFELYDVTGRRVAGDRLPGPEAAASAWTWRKSGEPLPAGVYFVRLAGAGWSKSLRVVVLR